MRVARFFFVLLFLTSCTPSPTPATEISPTQTQVSIGIPSATATQPPADPTVGGADLQKPATRPVYTLNVTLDYTAHYLAVTEQIVYTNNSADELAELPLLVEAENQGALFVLDAYGIDRDATWTVDPGLITIGLAQPLGPGEQATINLTYSLAIAEQAGTLGWTERQSDFVDWYPFIPPYLADQGWLINQPSAQGETLAYQSADFRVSLQAQNTPALFKIAAPAPAVEDGGALTYTLLDARRFSWAASGHFQTATATAGAVPVTIYFYEDERDAAEAALQAALQAVELYAELFGPYPYESLTIIECSFADGMESDALFFLDMEYFRRYNYSNRNLLTTLVAHEIAHNWWYGAVGNDPANEPWLDETLATYSELLFYERLHPNDVDWWWEFRVEQWAPEGWVDSSVYEHSQFRPYVNAVYLRGAQFLHELRAAMGDEAFFAFLQQFYMQGSGRIVSGEEFFARLENTAGIDEIRPILDEYFRLEGE